MKITVLYGGPSAEREVSLVSGRAVIDGLKRAGHDVYASDISPSDLSALDRPADVIFPVLHGAWGESGELQEILEARQLAFVGSGSSASRLGMDKVATKLAWRQAGLPTPAWQVVSLHQMETAPLPVIDYPCVVKPIDSGSSIDVLVFKTPDARKVQHAIATVAGKYGRALVEQYIAGPELTVGLLEERALAPIRIVAKGEFFDYEAKYKSDQTEHRFDTGLPDRVVGSCRELARRAGDVLGAVDLSRIDILLDAQHNPYLIEINTLPGFTPRSLLPEAAAHEGIDFVSLVDRLARRAHARHQQRMRRAG